MSTRALVSVLLAVLACHQQPMSPRFPASEDGLTLALAVTPPDLPQGAPASISLILTNTNPFSVSLSEGACALLFYVANFHGDTVYPPSGDWVCIDLIYGVTLAPGGRQTAMFVWDTTPVGSGIYSIYGTFAGAGLQLETPRAWIAVH